MFGRIIRDRNIRGKCTELQMEFKTKRKEVTFSVGCRERTRDRSHVGKVKESPESRRRDGCPSSIWPEIVLDWWTLGLWRSKTNSGTNDSKVPVTLNLSTGWRNFSLLKVSTFIKGWFFNFPFIYDNGFNLFFLLNCTTSNQ